MTLGGGLAVGGCGGGRGIKRMRLRSYSERTEAWENRQTT